MGLGSRGAHRHETVASKTAGVDPSAYWDFQPGQRVMTVDGFAGTVASVNDGPLAGTETYIVTLANNLGGGEYTASQLRATSDATGAVHHTADQDYPELGTILTDRPDIARNTVMAAKTASDEDIPEEYEEHWPDNWTQCPHCYQMVDTDHTPMSDHLTDEHDLDEEGQDRAWRHYHQGSLDDLDYRDRAPAAPSGYVDCPAPGCNHLINTADSSVEDHLRWMHPYLTESLPYEQPLMASAATDNEHGIETFEGQQPNDGAEPGVDEHGHLTWDGSSPGCRDTAEYSMFGQNDAVEHGEVAGRRAAHAAGTHDAWGRPLMQPYDGHDAFSCNNYGCTEHPQAMYQQDGLQGTPGWLEHDAHPEAGVRRQVNQAMPRQDTEDAAWLLGQQPTGPSKYSAFDPWAILATAATDPDFGFHVTAAWSDVRAKAKRIRAEGRVHVTLAREGVVVAEVKGDHHTYETGLQRLPGKSAVAQWSCGCKWGAYHWGADDDFSRFAGRMCSHALAVHYEAQARGMFGRTIVEDDTKPSWAPRRVVVKHDIDTGRDLTAPATMPGYSVAASLIRHALRAGEDLGEVTLALHTAGCGLGAIQAAVNDAWGEPDPPRPSYLPGPTEPRIPGENPASAGWASAPDPEGWAQHGPTGTMPVTTAAFTDERDRRTDVCAHCGQAVHDAGGIDPNVPWVHAGTGNAFCDVHGTSDATLLAGSPLERPEATPLVHESALEDEAVFEPEMSREAFLPLLLEALPALAEAGEAAGAAGAAGEAAGAGAAGEGAGGLGQTLKSKVPDLLRQHQQHQQQSEPEAQPSAPSAPPGPPRPGGTNPLDYGARATMHDQPEPALPSTDGDLEEDALDLGSPTSLEPADPSFVSTGAAQSVDDIVASFQATAGAKALQSGGARAASDGMDIAAAAKAHLAKSALKDFTPAEQAQIINEGEHVRAANLDRLDIAGTHYEPLEQALAAAEAQDDDDWMS